MPCLSMHKTRIPHLLTKIVGCTTQGPSDIRDIFGKAKIGNANVAIVVQQQVLRLQVSIDNIFSMQILECKHHLRRIKLGNVVWETL